MKKLILLLNFILLSVCGNAQELQEERALRAAFFAAKTMGNAMVIKDYDQYVEYNHPYILEKVEGGRSGMVIEIKRQIETLEESGNYVTAAWPSMPNEIIDTANELQCTMQQYVEYRLPNGKIKSETTIIGISPDRGNTWYFVDAANRPLTEIKNMFPTLSDRLSLAAPVEPVFTADK